MATKISIVTITRDNLAGLRRTVGSVCAQKCDDVEIEHIVVDGCSGDGTAAWLAGSYGTARVITSAPRGVYHAINTGVGAATGDIVMLLHAGDVYTSDEVLQRVAREFASDAEIGFLYGDVHFEDRHGRPRRYYPGDGCGLRRILDGYAPPHLSLAVRSDVARMIGPYSEDYIIAADFEMFARLFCCRRIKSVYLPLDMVAMQSGGISSRLYNRLVTNNREKLKALRRCGLPASPLRILRHYIPVITNLLWPKKR